MFDSIAGSHLHKYIRIQASIAEKNPAVSWCDCAYEKERTRTGARGGAGGTLSALLRYPAVHVLLITFAPAESTFTILKMKRLGS